METHELRDTLIICPVHNEEQHISDFYQALRNVCGGDILFIDDGSSDRSREFLLSIQDLHTFVRRNTQRLGYGAALANGFSFALKSGYQKVISIDADMQHRPQHIPVFARELIECEVVLGSRYITIAKTLDVPRERLTINRYIAGLFKELFEVSFSDPFCGFRGYRQSFLQRLQLKEPSYGAGLEILLEIIRTKTVFREIPIESIYFKDERTFLDGLNVPHRRLLHYLKVISGKRKEMLRDEKEVFVRQSAS